jgi:preprotein translocase SecE subunit
VARDRKRAKQRRDRRRAAAPERSTARVPPTQPTREDVPGALEHASSDVDEFDAALVRGADGVTAAPEDAAEAELDSERELEEEQDVELPAAAGDGGRRDGGTGAAVADGAGEALPVEPAGEHAPPSVRSVRRAVAFLQASWAELQRVQWPDRRQVVQATAVVLGFVIVAGVYLGVADFVAKEIVEFVL